MSTNDFQGTYGSSRTRDHVLDSHYRPAALRAKQLREKRELEESKYEAAEDMAFTELISYGMVGVDAFHAHKNHEANPSSII